MADEYAVRHSLPYSYVCVLIRHTTCTSLNEAYVTIILADIVAFTPMFTLYSTIHACSLIWCFCHMVVPALRIFFVDPVLSSSAKTDVSASLATACSEAAAFSKPVSALLHSVLSVAETPPVPTPMQFYSTLEQLQLCRDGPCDEFADHLNSLMSILQYFKFHQKLTTPSMAELVTSACKALFPASLLSSQSIHNLATPTMKSLPLELFMEYGILLMECLVQARAEKKIILETAFSLRLLGCHPSLSMKRSEVRHMIHVCADV